MSVKLTRLLWVIVVVIDVVALLAVVPYICMVFAGKVLSMGWVSYLSIALLVINFVFIVYLIIIKIIYRAK
ncbi:MAG: hypothetical protein E7356_01650 [Clostridiales bacterium]|nr:hypothetical protein [Clostridiales bacterium]